VFFKSVYQVKSVHDFFVDLIKNYSRYQGIKIVWIHNNIFKSKHIFGCPKKCELASERLGRFFISIIFIINNH